MRRRSRLKRSRSSWNESTSFMLRKWCCISGDVVGVLADFKSRTRAYRMKLKEWGLMRHKQRSTNKIRHATRHTSKDATVDNAGCETDAIAVDQQTQEDGAKTSDWQLVASQPSLVADGPDEVTEHMFAGLLDQPVE